MKKWNRQAGFTLLEILLSLLIFSILSLILAGALRTVINAQEDSEQHAERLRYLQLAFLLISRDVEQAVDRPIYNQAGKEEKPLAGELTQLTLTHSGLANPDGELVRSHLQRSSYRYEDGQLLKVTWPVLDQAPKTRPTERVLLSDVEYLRFQYLDKDKKFHDNWPLDAKSKQTLPRAVKITMDLKDWGKVSQLYVIPAEVIESNEQQKKQQRAKPDEKPAARQ